MKFNRSLLIASMSLASALSAFAAQEATFTPTGVLDMIPTSMTDDASIVVGSGIYGTPNLYYTEANGVVVIGDGCSSGLPAISGDGSTVLGCNVDADGHENAARWLGGTSWEDLGTVAGGVACDAPISGAYDVNHDGSLGVGLVYLPQICRAGAGTWDLVNGGPATALPALFGDTTYSRANAVNADGSVIVGWQDQMSGERTAAKWVNGVEEIILTPNGDFNGEALAVSANGRAIVGTSYAFGGTQAWISRDGVVTPIGMSVGGFADASFTALSVSDDGRFVVGFARKSFLEKAFIWHKNAGTATSLEDYITKRGAVVPAGWSLTVASLVSTDGRFIYGWGFNPDSRIEMFKIELSNSAE